jgi:tryptophan halogenase
MNSTLRADDVPSIHSPFELADTPAGIVLRSSREVLRLTGIDAGDLQRLLAAIDGRRTVAEVAGVLGGDYDEESVVDAMSTLVGSVLRLTRATTSVRRDVSSTRVLVLGGGGLARLVMRRLRASGYLAARSAPVAEGASALQEQALVICALEGVSYRALLEAHEACRTAGVPCLLVEPLLDGGVALGPVSTPSGPACAECALRGHHHLDGIPDGLDLLDLFDVRSLDRARAGSTLSAALDTLIGEVDALAADHGAPRLLAMVEAVFADGTRRRTPVQHHARCRSCATGSHVAVEDTLSALGQVTRANVVARMQDPTFCATSRPPPSEYRRIGILGGGTAGYLTALSLRAARPDLEVTLIESSKIPVIGVGEATTSEIVPYLHHFLGIDIHEFYREVLPTFKLGIKFDWGRASQPCFHYPFDVGRPLEAMLYDGHLRHVSLLAMMMDEDRVPILACGDRHVSLLSDYPFAYHLENKRLVAFLKKRAAAVGVGYLDARIVDAVLSDAGDEIACLVAEDGQRLEFDLYIDCSGFRSALLEQKLGSPFRSYASSLFTDTAVVAAVPHDGVIKPYTTAETMSSGWCWNIPQVEEDHRGYVFSSSFCTVDQAVDEMRAKNPRMADPWTVKFRSGRHEHFWKGNVVAIGNAYGFVEPLESTAIQVIIVENQYLLAHLPSLKSEVKPKELLNQRVAEYWDYLRWFLSIHYKFNHRFSTPFWQACRRDADIGGANDIVDLFREGAPLTYKRGPAALSRLTFDAFGFDVLLFGQDVEARRVAPREGAAEYAQRKAACQTLTRRALPQREALAVLAKRPDLRAEHIHRPDGWIARYSRVMRAVG